jgi:hypothetical protein
MKPERPHEFKVKFTDEERNELLYLASVYRTSFAHAIRIAVTEEYRRQVKAA